MDISLCITIITLFYTVSFTYNIKSKNVSWNVTQSSLVETDKRFETNSCFCL
jgi:hypothetical protein